MAAVVLLPLNVSCSFDRSGNPYPFVCGETITTGQVVYQSSDGLIHPALADTQAHSTVLGVVVNSPNSPWGETTTVVGDSVSVAIAGLVFIPGALVGSSLLTPGAPLFLSRTVAGGLDTAAPTGAWQIMIARVEDNDKIFIMPGLSNPVSA